MFDYYSSEISFMIKEILESTHPGIYKRKNWSGGQKAKSGGQKAEKPADVSNCMGGRENSWSLSSHDVRSQDLSNKGDTERHLALDTCFQFQIFADSSDTWIRGYTTKQKMSKMQNSVFNTQKLELNICQEEGSLGNISSLSTDTHRRHLPRKSAI